MAQESDITDSDPAFHLWIKPIGIAPMTGFFNETKFSEEHHVNRLTFWERRTQISTIQVMGLALRVVEPKDAHPHSFSDTRLQMGPTPTHLQGGFVYFLAIFEAPDRASVGAAAGSSTGTHRVPAKLLGLLKVKPFKPQYRVSNKGEGNDGYVAEVRCSDLADDAERPERRTPCPRMKDAEFAQAAHAGDFCRPLLDRVSARALQEFPGLLPRKPDRTAPTPPPTSPLSMRAQEKQPMEASTPADARADGGHEPGRDPPGIQFVPFRQWQAAVHQETPLAACPSQGTNVDLCRSLPISGRSISNHNYFRTQINLAAEAGIDEPQLDWSREGVAWRHIRAAMTRDTEIFHTHAQMAMAHFSNNPMEATRLEIMSSPPESILGRIRRRMCSVTQLAEVVRWAALLDLQRILRQQQAGTPGWQPRSQPGDSALLIYVLTGEPLVDIVTTMEVAEDQAYQIQLHAGQVLMIPQAWQATFTTPLATSHGSTILAVYRIARHAARSQEVDLRNWSVTVVHECEARDAHRTLQGGRGHTENVGTMTVSLPYTVTVRAVFNASLAHFQQGIHKSSETPVLIHVSESKTYFNLAKAEIFPNLLGSHATGQERISRDVCLTLKTTRPSKKRRYSTPQNLHNGTAKKARTAPPDPGQVRYQVVVTVPNLPHAPQTLRQQKRFRFTDLPFYFSREQLEAELRARILTPGAGETGEAGQAGYDATLLPGFDLLYTRTMLTLPSQFLRAPAQNPPVPVGVTLVWSSDSVTHEDGQTVTVEMEGAPASDTQPGSSDASPAFNTQRQSSSASQPAMLAALGQIRQRCGIETDPSAAQQTVSAPVALGATHQRLAATRLTGQPGHRPLGMDGGSAAHPPAPLARTAAMARETQQRLIEATNNATTKGTSYYQTVKTTLMRVAQAVLNPASPTQGSEPVSKHGGGNDGRGRDGGRTWLPQTGIPVMAITALLLMFLLILTATPVRDPLDRPTAPERASETSGQQQSTSPGRRQCGRLGRISLLLCDGMGNTQQASSTREHIWHDQATAIDIVGAPNVWQTREDAAAAIQWRIDGAEARRARLTTALVDGKKMSLVDQIYFTNVCRFESYGWQQDAEAKALPQMDGGDVDSDDELEAGARDQKRSVQPCARHAGLNPSPILIQNPHHHPAPPTHGAAARQSPATGALQMPNTRVESRLSFCDDLVLSFCGEHNDPRLSGLSLCDDPRLYPDGDLRLSFCDDLTILTAEISDAHHVGVGYNEFTWESKRCLEAARRKTCASYLGVPLERLAIEGTALITGSQRVHPSLAQADLESEEEAEPEADLEAGQRAASESESESEAEAESELHHAGRMLRAHHSGRNRVQESFAALSGAFTEVTRAMASLHADHPEVALPLHTPLMTETFHTVTQMMASMRTSLQDADLLSPDTDSPASRQRAPGPRSPPLEGMCRVRSRHMPSTDTDGPASRQQAPGPQSPPLAGMCRVRSRRVRSAPEPGMCRVMINRMLPTGEAHNTLEWPLSTPVHTILTQAICHFCLHGWRAGQEFQFVHRDEAGQTRTVPLGSSIQHTLSAMATREELTYREIALTLVTADDSPNAGASQPSQMRCNGQASTTATEAQGFAFEAPPAHTVATGAASAAMPFGAPTVEFVFTGQEFNRWELDPALQGTPMTTRSWGVAGNSEGHAGEDRASGSDARCSPTGTDTYDCDEDFARPIPQLDGAGSDSDSEYGGSDMAAPTCGPSVDQRHQLQTLQPALTDLFKAIRYGTRLRNIAVCEENVATAVRMTVDDDNALRSRQGIRALDKSDTDTRDSRAAPMQEDTVPSLQAAWLTFTHFHSHVAEANGLHTGALESVSRRIAAALGIHDAVAQEQVAPYSACPSTQTPPLQEARVFHGVRRMALRTAPLDFELHRALDKPFIGNELMTGVGFASPRTEQGPSAQLCRVITIPMTPSHPERTPVTIWLRQGQLVAIEGSAAALGPVELRTPDRKDKGAVRKSRFLPPEFRWTATFKRHADGTPDYASGLMIKPFDTTGVMRHAKAWPASIRYLSATCKIILQGRVHLPTVGAGIRMSISPNLGSVENDKPLLYKLVAKYLISGVLQYCPPECPPINIIPLGLVPKKDDEEPWRCILDARTLNEDLQYLPSSMCGIAASASLFTRGAFGFMKDISAAYHNVVLGSGCDNKRCLGCPTCKAPMTEAAALAAGGTVAAEWKRSKRDTRKCVYEQTGLQCLLGDMRAAPSKPGQPLQSKRRFFNVCAPGVNCRGSCQPQFYGIELDGVRFRYTVCPFGVRTSGNMWADLIAPVIAKYRSRGHRVIIWVDDVLVLTVNECTQQDSCGGKDACPTCTECWRASTALEAEFQADLDSLGFETNTKNVPPTTTGAFLGLIFCTKTETFSFPIEKATAFAEACSKLLDKGSATKRELASITGRLCWWAPAILHVPLLTTGLTRLTGGEETPGKWDEVVKIDEQVRFELQHWRDNIEACARQPIPMIPPSLQQLEADWRAQSYFGRLQCLAKRGKPSGRFWACTNQTPLQPAPTQPRLAPYKRALASHARRQNSASTDHVKLPRKLVHKLGNSMLGTDTVIYVRGKRYTPINEKTWRPQQRAGSARPFTRRRAVYNTACKFLLCTDAGPLKWGATLRTHTGQVLRASGVYPTADESGVDKHRVADDQDLRFHEQQPWREGYASLMGILSFERHIQGQAVLHHGDCMCAVAAINKGSATSTILHSLALRIWRATSARAILLYSGWVPGKDIIRSGADGLSREEGYDWGGVSATGNAWTAVSTLLKRHQWQLTVDLFASEENAKTQRFYSMYHEPKSERVDAFTAPSWTHSECPLCKVAHRETVLAFPPHALLTRVWGKLERDGARGIAIMKCHVSHPAYPIMLRGKISPAFHLTGKDFSLPTGCGPTLEKHGIRTDKYIAVAFDFSVDIPLTPPCSPVNLPQQAQQPPCPQFAHYREYTAPPSRSAQEDRLLRLALAESTRQAREGELRGYNGN